MKQALKLSLAISLALGAGQVFAIGLGQIQVKSRLNQPLDAEIPVIVDRRGEAESLVVTLASADEFSRAGLERSQVPLEFALGQSARGETVIRVTSKEAVRAPFLDFLLEANWSNGRVLREYTVLLDPPLTTPATAAKSIADEPAARPVAPPPPPPPVVAAPPPAVPASVAKAEPPPAAIRAEPALPPPRPPALVTRPERSPAQPPVAVAPPTAKPDILPAQRPPQPAARALPPSVAASNGTNYGPVASGETLWEIAQATLPDDGVSANQLMLALLKANPDAFVRNNINQLKRGAILRIPSGEEIRAVGSMRVAAAQVQTQIAEWRGENIRPTLLAGSAASVPPGAGGRSAAAAGRVDDRLALVPPELGKDGLASTGQAGSSAGAAGGNASAAELARANESLATQTREAGELRTRVKDLEGLQSKNERLISLKDSEIADLQRKLAAVQAAPSGKPATEPAKSDPATVANVNPSPSSSSALAAKDDIWGKTTPSTTVAPGSSEAIAGAANSDASTMPAAQSSAASAAASSSSAAPTTVDPAVAVVADPTASSSSAATTTPAGNATEATPPAGSAAAPPESPSVVEPAPLTTPATAAVVVPEEPTPWYLDPRILGGAGILALLAGFLALRSRRQPTAAARPSLADQFGAGNVAAVPVIAQAADGAILNDEETQLRDQIAFKPDDLGARLELLSIYYADNRVDEFRDGAAEMEHYVDNPREPEWVQVRAMGEDLFPNDPLFASATSDASRSSDAESARWDEETAPIVADDIDEVRWSDADIEVPVATPPATTRYDEQLYAPVRTADPLPEAPPSDLRDVEAELAALDHKPLDDGLELSFDDDFLDEPRVDVLPAAPAPSPAVASGRPLTEFAPEKKDESFGFDLPPLDFDMEFSKPQPTVTPVASLNDGLVDSDDEFFVGEDALGTKLDLARAYADMGDPEGARAMLEEVIAEGDSEQQEQARKLLIELG